MLPFLDLTRCTWCGLLYTKKVPFQAFLRATFTLMAVLIWPNLLKATNHPSPPPPAIAKTQFPTSVSISEILQAGKLVKPKPKKKATLVLEKFDIKTGEWHEEGVLDLLVDAEKFSSGGFRDAFLATSCNREEQQNGLLKSTMLKPKTPSRTPSKQRKKITLGNKCKCTLQKDSSQSNLALRPQAILASLSTTTVCFIQSLKRSQQQWRNTFLESS